MKKVPHEILQLPIHLREEMALREAFADVLAEHKRLGLPLAISRNGQVVWVSAEELEAEQTKEAPPAPDPFSPPPAL